MSQMKLLPLQNFIKQSLDACIYFQQYLKTNKHFKRVKQLCQINIINVINFKSKKAGMNGNKKKLASAF